MTVRNARKAATLTAADKAAAIADGVPAMVDAVRLTIAARKADRVADNAFALSAITAATLVHVNKCSANAVAAANAAALTDGDKAEAETYGVPVYTVRQSVGYHANTGLVFLLPEDESTPLTMSAEAVQRVVKAARDAATPLQAENVCRASMSRSSAVKALQALTRSAKAAAAAEAERKAAEAEAAALAEAAEDEAEAVSTDRGHAEDVVTDGEDVFPEGDEGVDAAAAALVIDTDAAAIADEGPRVISKDEAHAEIVAALTAAAALAAVHGLPAEAAAILARML